MPGHFSGGTGWPAPAPANNLRKVEQCLVLNDLFGSALPCSKLWAWWCYTESPRRQDVLVYRFNLYLKVVEYPVRHTGDSIG